MGLVAPEQAEPRAEPPRRTGGQHREEDKVVLANENDMTGRMITVKKLVLEITRNQIEEIFGQFTCRCDAWSQKGRTSSKNATVEISCK